MLHYFQLLVPSQPVADSEQYEHLHHCRKLYWMVLLLNKKTDLSHRQRKFSLQYHPPVVHTRDT